MRSRLSFPHCTRSVATVRLRAAAALWLIWPAWAGASVRAENVDPADDGSQYAWAENAGWINCEPGGDGGPGMRVGDFDVTGWLWSENVGWVSLSCENTASCAVTPYGVRNDGTGQLSGSAWSENAGWIDFGPAGAGVIVDPTTGVVSGRAWAENLGWVSFASATASPPFRVETGWRCDPTPAPPSASPWLLVSHSGAEIALSWSATDGATGYDVVTGLLDDLRASGGDFSLVESCLADDLPAVELQIADADGPSRWYLVRGVNCGGEGSWDTGLPSQIGSRDPGIGASPLSCP